MLKFFTKTIYNRTDLAFSMLVGAMIAREQIVWTIVVLLVGLMLSLFLKALAKAYHINIKG